MRIERASRGERRGGETRPDCDGPRDERGGVGQRVQGGKGRRGATMTPAFTKGFSPRAREFDVDDRIERRRGGRPSHPLPEQVFLGIRQKPSSRRLIGMRVLRRDGLGFALVVVAPNVLRARQRAALTRPERRRLTGAEARREALWRPAGCSACLACAGLLKSVRPGDQPPGAAWSSESVGAETLHFFSNAS